MSVASTQAGTTVLVSESELTGWSERRPLAFRLALWWARHMPRAKGWLPHQLGRWLGRGMKTVVITPGGAKLAVDPRNLEIYTAILNGIWDRHVLESACGLLKDGQVFYDVGASSGVMSMEVARRFSDRVAVYTFEPQPSLARAIALAAGLNKFQNVHVFDTLLGREPGEADLHVPRYSVHASMVPRSASATRIRCRVTTIDALVESEVIPPPDVIKIDVEGAELDVFRGAAGVIRRFRPHVLFESDVNSARFGYTRRQLCDYLRQQADYRFAFVTPEGLEPVGDRMDDQTQSDLVAVPGDLEREQPAHSQP